MDGNDTAAQRREPTNSEPLIGAPANDRPSELGAATGPTSVSRWVGSHTLIFSLRCLALHASGNEKCTAG